MSSTPPHRSIEIQASYPSPGRGPAGLAWDGRHLWNADFAGGKIHCIDPDDGRLLKTLVCPGNLSGLAWDGTQLWQSLHDGGALRAINPHTNDFDQTILVHEHGWLSGVAWDGQQLWAASQQHGRLFALDRETGDVIRTIPVPVAGGGLAFHQGHLWLGIPFPMAFNQEGGYFDWVGEPHQFALLQLDPTTGAELGRYSLPFMPMGLAWAGEALWLSQVAERKLYRAALP